MDTIVCRNLELSIDHSETFVEVRLEDPMDMTEVIIKREIGATTTASRAYHVKEAIVIGIRAVVAEAFDKGMMRVDVSKLRIAPNQKISRRQQLIDDFMKDDSVDLG